jgi:hypothetical protein
MSDEWNGREREDLLRLRREVPPPLEMEAELLARLSREGLLSRRSRSRRWVAPLAAAAAAGIFALGLGLGGAWRKPPAPPTPPVATAATGPRYVLFVEVGPGQAVTGDALLARIQEYRDWSVRMRASGNGLGGEKLAGGGWTLEGEASGPLRPAPDGFETGGYFLLTARDDAEALEIARTHPHLKHGGRMVLRRIDDV